MTARVSDIDNAINLLRKLIDKTPTDKKMRLQLLTLLYNNRRKVEFFEEAFMYKANCDISFDTNWETICEMGRGIDPANGFFGKGPSTGTQGNGNGRSPARQQNARPDPETITEPENPAPQPEQQPQDEAREDPATGRRRLTDRRKCDRRKNFSAWFGEERRITPRRWKRRRAADSASRKK